MRVVVLWVCVIHQSSGSIPVRSHSFSQCDVWVHQYFSPLCKNQKSSNSFREQKVVKLTPSGCLTLNRQILIQNQKLGSHLQFLSFVYIPRIPELLFLLCWFGALDCDFVAQYDELLIRAGLWDWWYFLRYWSLPNQQWKNLTWMYLICCMSNVPLVHKKVYSHLLRSQNAWVSARSEEEPQIVYTCSGEGKEAVQSSDMRWSHTEQDVVLTELLVVERHNAGRLVSQGTIFERWSWRDNQVLDTFRLIYP